MTFENKADFKYTKYITIDYFINCLVISNKFYYFSDSPYIDDNNNNSPGPKILL